MNNRVDAEAATPPGPGPTATVSGRDPRAASQHPPAVLASGATHRPSLHEARVLCWDNFLPGQERDALFEHVTRVGRASAEVATTYGSDGGRRVRPELRRALRLPNDEVVRAIAEPLIASARDHALRYFQLEVFPMGRIEMEVAASGEGDYFRKHSDDSHPEFFSRILSFVYYLHAHPRRFRGGALRVYDSLVESDHRTIADSFVEVDPLDNRLVIFPSDRVHEVMPVSLDSADFGDRRITINGACWCEGDAAEVMERWRAANPAPRS